MDLASGKVVGDVFLLIAITSVALLVIITASMIYFVLRYHQKRHPEPADIEGRMGLEILWTVIPTLIVLVLFYYGYTGFRTLKEVPADAVKVKVIARQWSWLFEYENGTKSEDLRVPMGKTVSLSLTSQDVIHSFYIPAFRVKQDAVPGMTTHLAFRADRLGEYDALCAEYCGVRHASMLAKVKVLTEEEFREWLHQGVKKEVERPPTGQVLFREKGCGACHPVDGASGIGPSLLGLYRREVTVITEGKERKVLADEVYLRRSILEPNADVVKGFPAIMPSQKGVLTEKELEGLLDYIKGLKEVPGVKE